jgi:hypothetical protein
MLLFIVVCFLFQIFSKSAIAITFRDQSSTIELINGSTYKQSNVTANKITGTFKLSSDSSLTTDNPLYFENGIYSENGQELILTGTLDSSQTYSIRLLGSASARSLFDTSLRARIYVSGSGNRIEGRPGFLTPDAIQLADASASLVLGTEGIYDQTLVLNNGSIVLDNDFKLGQGVVFGGSGTVNLGGNNLIFGSTESLWTGTIQWINANNIDMAGDVRLTGQWIFSGDGTVLGGNNVLDLSSTGSIRIKADSRLELNNLIINGLGTGTIFFDDNTSILSFKNCVINLDSNYSVTSGLWSVDGPMKVVVNDNYLRFASSSQLAVGFDAALEYDTLRSNDNKNVIVIGSSNPIADCGLIRNVTVLPGADFNYTGNITLSAGLGVTPLRYLNILSDAVIDGAGFAIQFARQPGTPILLSEAGVSTTFQNVALKDFPVTTTDSRLRDGSRLTFGHMATVELGDSATLTSTWYFSGTTVLNGKGNILTLGSDGNIVLRPGASILFDNIILNNIHGYNISCMDDTATVTFGSVILQQDADYSFTRGALYVRDSLDLIGSATFRYASQRVSTIANNGILRVNNDTTFLYAPSIADKTLLQFADTKATLELKGGTLATTTTGMQLTVGTLHISTAGILKNFGALSNSEAIIIGDGNPAHDLTLKINAAVELNPQSGILLFMQN